MNASTGNTVIESSLQRANSSCIPGVLQFVEQLGLELSEGTLYLPSFPDVIVRIQRILADPDTTTAAVAQVVRGEPVFTAKLFRIANSVMLQRGSEPVTDLSIVINRVGFDTVRNLAVALATRQIMSSRKYSALRNELRVLWEHSIDTAAIAFVVARNSGCVNPDDALLTGLTHDIGTFYIYSRMRDFPVLFNDENTISQIVDEWHCAIGRAILDAWEFPSNLIEAVDEHETLDRTHAGPADLTDVIIAANLLAHWQKPSQKPIDLDTVPALERLELTGRSAVEKLEESYGEVESLKAALR